MESEIKNSIEKKLVKYNKFTETSPAFRANFIIKKKMEAFLPISLNILST